MHRIEGVHRSLKDERNLFPADLLPSRFLSYQADSSPSKRIFPRVMVALRGSSLGMDKMVVVFPQPDSPAIPNTSPLFSEKLTPSTACTRPERDVN